MNQKTHRAEFLKQLKLLFPYLTPMINQEHGLLQGEMTVLHNHVQDLIKRNDAEKIKKAFELVDDFYTTGDNKLKNAIDVSFIEGLRFKNNEWAWKLLSPQLQRTHLDFHEGLYG